jgi:uncharacterized protein
MAVIGNAMGRKSLWIYLTSIIGGALLFGTLVNELIPRHWITDYIPAHFAHGLHEHSAGWFGWASTSLLVLLILNGYIMKIVTGRRRKMKEGVIIQKMNTMENAIYQFRVEGMTCEHCKASVEKGLKSNPQVSSVLADPGMNLVTIQAESLPDASVKETIERLGYIFGGRA